MKTKIFSFPLAILLMVVTTYQLKSQTWTPLTSGITTHLYAVSVPSSTTCYVAGGAGKILKTINGGASWTQQTSGTIQDLFSIVFTDLNNGYAVGNNGAAIKTSNGGITWSSMPVGTGTGVGFRGVYFSDSITGFIVGGTNGGGVPGTMLKTTNAGLTWTILTTSPASTNSLYSIFFTSSSDGYSAGFDGKVIKTTDGGTSWSAISTGNANPLLGVVKFTSISTGFVQGLNGTILTTNNSGIAWYALTSGTSDDLFGIDFYNANNGSAVGGNVGANTGKIIVTTDGGITWAPVTLSPGTSRLNRVDFVDQNTGYVVGMDGTILKYSACPMANAGISKTICSDSSVTIGGSPTAIGGASPYTYVWAPTSGLNSSTISNPTAYPTTTTTYTVTITDNSGCIAATDSVLVTVYLLPTVNAGSPFSICLGESATLAVSGNASTYTWNNGISDGVSFTPTTTTTYIVTGTTNGCSQNDTVLVTVNPKPTLVTNNPAAICLPETVDLTLPAVTAGSTGGLTLTYFIDAGATILYATPTTATSGTYYIVGTVLATGCSDTTSVTVTVNPKPDVFTTAPAAVCSPATEDITLPNVTAGSTGGLTFTYFTDAGATVSYATPTTAASGTYYIVGTVLATGCSDTTSVTVTVNPKPDVFTTAPAAVCSPAIEDITLPNVTAGSTGGLTFTYFTDAGATLVYATPTIADSGTYYIVGVQTSSGCSDTTSVMVAVNPKPTVIITPPAATCSPATVDLTETSVTAGSTAGLTYTYFTDAGATLVYSTPTNAITGTYYIVGLLTSSGCSDTTAVMVTVNPKPIVIITNPAAICSPVTVDLTSTSVTLGSSAGLIYTYFTDSGATLAYNTPTNAITGTYFIVGAIPATGCSDTTAVTVTANPLPIVTANTNADTVCAGTSVTLTGGGTASSYTWTGGVNDAIGFAPGSTQTYTVTGIDGNNCSDTSSITITVNPAPIANAGPDNNLCSGDTVFLSGTGGISYLWTDGTNSYTTSTILASPTASTSYTLTVTDNSGCSATDIASVSVTAGKDLYGHVDFSGGNIVNGNVVIYRHKPVQTQFDTTQVAALDSLGNYHFTGINPKNYLIKVFADTITYPTVIPTYYGNTFRWNGSAVLIVHHDCTVSDTLNTITMIELTGTGGGNGIIKGKIIKGNGFERIEGEPIPGIDVKLGKNPGGSVTATTSTDETGDYTFSGVANGNYTIYVDIPGLGCDSSYTFTIDSINNQFLNQNYTADSSMIFITPYSGLGINSSTASFENKFNVYPNPVIGNTTIEYSILQMTEVKTSLDVYNLLGLKISSLVNATQHFGNYKYNFNPQNYNLNSGVYFITLTIDGKTTTKRIVVME